MAQPEYDKVTQASLNGIYVKAIELDRNHNDHAAPGALPPGAVSDDGADAQTGASAADAQSRASVADAEAQTGAPAADVTAHASDAATHASDGK